MEGSGGLHILAAGEVRIQGQEVNISGPKGVTMYEEKVVLNLEKLLETEEGVVLPEVIVTAKGKVELSVEEESEVHNRGEKVTYYLAWEHEDLSHPSNRYQDEPEQKDYDWAQWRMNITAGILVVGSVTALGALVVDAAVGAGMITAGSAAAFTGTAIFLTGILYVGEQAISDTISGRLRDTEKYVRRFKEMKEEFCSCCNRKICRNDAIFYMPKLPVWNKLYDLNENVFHIKCIKSLDTVRYVGKELADLTEKISRVSEDAPFLIRNGNIVALGDMNEMSIEINDFEDFVQFNIPVAHLNCIDNLQSPKVIQNRTTSISFLQNGKLKLITFYYEIELEYLSSIRLKEIVKGIKDLNIFSDIESLKKDLIEKFSKKRKKNS